MYAWYSGEADRMQGHTVYRTSEGEMVTCTEVCPDPTSSSGWKDKKFVGEVTEWVSTHHHNGRHELIFGQWGGVDDNQWAEVYDVRIPPKYTPPQPRRSFFR